MLQALVQGNLSPAALQTPMPPAYSPMNFKIQRNFSQLQSNGAQVTPTLRQNTNSGHLNNISISKTNLRVPPISNGQLSPDPKFGIDPIIENSMENSD